MNERDNTTVCMDLTAMSSDNIITKLGGETLDATQWWELISQWFLRLPPAPNEVELQQMGCWQQETSAQMQRREDL